MSDLEAAVKKAVAAFHKLSHAEQAAVREAQRKSWVVSELLLQHPEMSYEEASAIYDQTPKQQQPETNYRFPRFGF